MRLDLEEYDCTVEYLRGKDNYVADALSRITIKDLKEINNKNNKVYKVTTRAMTNKAFEKYQVIYNKRHLNDKPNIFVPIII